MRSLRDDRDSSVADYSAAVPHISRGDRGSGLSCQRHDGPSGCSAHVDRLARSTRDLLNVLDAVAQRQAGFKSIADPMIDTTSPHGKLILAVLGALAEFERSMILARTAEGRVRAMARRVRFGRKPKLSAFQITEALARPEAGVALTDIGRSYGVSHSTISRL